MNDKVIAKPIAKPSAKPSENQAKTKLFGTKESMTFSAKKHLLYYFRYLRYLSVGV